MLPKNHRLVELIIRQEHERNLHSGAKTTIYAIRQRFWSLSIGSTVNSILKKCITCFKCKPAESVVKMGDLLTTRINPSEPFSNCGVDYTGPLMIKERKHRNLKIIKSYVCICVCFATKAAHIELVSDMTSEAFCGALKRFVARRGKPEKIYSDNGTNFVGAFREINEIYELFQNEQFKNKLNDFCLESRISWQFIPPNAPHYGGLWESSVKSAKVHLYWVVRNAHLTFEEITTLLCEIEAILNSRPITPLSNDPCDISCLTPGHFLIGKPLNSIAQPSLTNLNENKLSRWQYVEQLSQHFWKRWSLEYMNTLQQRNKWRVSKGAGLCIDQIVSVKTPEASPYAMAYGKNYQSVPWV